MALKDTVIRTTLVARGSLAWTSVEYSYEGRGTSLINSMIFPSVSRNPIIHRS